jgi:hypothetical protein
MDDTLNEGGISCPCLTERGISNLNGKDGGVVMWDAAPDFCSIRFGRTVLAKASRMDDTDLDLVVLCDSEV